MNKKLMSAVLVSMLSISMVACSSELDTTKYSTEQGLQAVNRFKENKDEYKEVTQIGVGSDLEKNDLVKITIVVDDIDMNERDTTIGIDYDKTDNIQWSTTTPMRIIFPSIGVNTKFKKGDTITVYGRYYDIVKKTYASTGKTTEYYDIGGHFIEIK